MSDNQHPADELFRVRGQLRELKEREEELRAEILSLPRLERGGCRYCGRVLEKFHKALDVDAVEKKFGDLSEFLYQATILCYLSG